MTEVTNADDEATESGNPARHHSDSPAATFANAKLLRAWTRRGHRPALDAAPSRVGFDLVQLHHPQIAIGRSHRGSFANVRFAQRTPPHVLLDFNGEDGQIVVQVSIAAPSNDFFLQRLDTLAKWIRLAVE